MAAPTTHSGFMIQSTYGTVGNLELVVASAQGGLAHCWRDNDTSGFPWTGPTYFGTGDVLGVSLIQTNYGALGKLAVVVREGNHLGYYERLDQPPYTWYGPIYVAVGVTGNPALVQTRFGSQGNFEVVAPLTTGGMGHFWRDNDDPTLPWIGPTEFATALGQVDAVALVHSTLGHPGNLELVARAGDQLYYLWRDSGPGFAWSDPVPFFSGAAGIPGFIQSRYGSLGNFDVVTPLVGGGMAHLWRDNDDPAFLWASPLPFGDPGTEVAAVALVHGTLGSPGIGNLEVAARVGGQTVQYYREDQPDQAWVGPSGFICGEPAYDLVTQGEWRVPFGSGVVGVHAAQLHTGQVLFFSYEEHGGQLHGDASVLDPQSGLLYKAHADKNLFCAGQAFLPDGRLIVAGGAATGVKALHSFTPGVEGGGTWQDLGDMSDDRWYPTCTCLPDGRLFILSGSKNGGGPRIDPHSCTVILATPPNDTYEIYDPAVGFQPPGPAPIVNESDPYCLFPFVFGLPHGKLLIHSGTLTRFLDLATWGFDDTILTTQSPTARTYPSTGTAVLLPLLPDASPPYRARVMLIGGAGVSCPFPGLADTPATNTCELLDLGAPLGWQHAAPMPHPRVMPDAVLLPDGTVLVVNGSSTGVADNGINPVLEADLYDPATDTWTTLGAMRVPRLYHSTALLLPDGRVLTAGKDEEFNPYPFNYPEYRIEVFSPPYLFKGPRPVIAAAPSAIGYAATFDVDTPDAGAITAAALLAPGAVTHSFNMGQRHVGLQIVATGTGAVSLAAPPDPHVAPPGYYMLFLLNAAGVPSIASFVHLT